MTGITEAHARLLREGKIQVAFPPDAATPELPTPPPDYVLWFVQNGHYVFWPLVTLLVVAVLGVVGRYLFYRGAPSVLPAAPTLEVVMPPVHVTVVLADPDALAAAGQYDAALHLLLLRAVGLLQQRHPRAIGPAATSRDIAALDPLTPLERVAFTALATPVERARFAGQVLGRAEWERGRAEAAALV